MYIYWALISIKWHHQNAVQRGPPIRREGYCIGIHINSFSTGQEPLSGIVPLRWGGMGLSLPLNPGPHYISHNCRVGDPVAANLTSSNFLQLQAP